MKERWQGPVSRDAWQVLSVLLRGYPKGKGAAYGDTAIRNFLRQRGYVDSKSCAVSPELTATRYGRKG